MKDADLTWLAEHGADLHEKYAGKWIAVYNGEVVGVGETATEAAAQADTKLPAGNYVLQALDISNDLIWSPFC